MERWRIYILHFKNIMFYCLLCITSFVFPEDVLIQLRLSVVKACSDWVVSHAATYVHC